jgi:hypothetical protein
MRRYTGVQAFPRTLAGGNITMRAQDYKGCKLTGHGNSLASAIEVHDSSVTLPRASRKSIP